MSKEKISIIIPVMNAGRYLRECLESIVDQTYTNLEILIIYTESSDDTYSICKEFENLDDRIILLYNQTGLIGPGVSRNIGLERMTGDLLGFVDADDVIAADMYELLYADLKSHNADMAVCRETRRRNDIKKLAVFSRCTTELTKIEALAEFLSGSRFHGELWNKLYKKSCIEGLEFIETGIGQDIMYVWNVIQNTEKIVYTNAKRYFYRFNPNGISKQYKIEYIERKIRLYESIRKDVYTKYPAVIRQLENRLSIVNAQNYIMLKLSHMQSPCLEAELLSSRKKYKFKMDGNHYSRKEQLEARLFEFSPKMAYGLYVIYTKMKGR